MFKLKNVALFFVFLLLSAPSFDITGEQQWSNRKTINRLQGVDDASPLLNGLLGYWKMDGDANASVGPNGSVVGTGSSFVTGLIGQGLRPGVNPTAGYISVPATTISPTAALTFLGWVKAPSGAIPDNGRLFDQFPNIAGQNRQIVLFRSGTNIINYIVRPSTTDLVQSVTTVAALEDDVWHMLVLTYDGAVIRSYLDGTQVDSDAWVGTFNASTDTVFFGQGHLTGPMAGALTIDEVGIWNRALTTTEITELYNGGAGKTYPF